jgi:hypothetical protein
MSLLARLRRHPVLTALLLAAVCVATFMFTVAFTLAAVPAQGNTQNDVVYTHNEGYTEVFKQETSHGDKNHMYTYSTIEAPKPGECVVVTGDSEQGVGLSCNYGAR